MAILSFAQSEINHILHLWWKDRIFHWKIYIFNEIYLHNIDIMIVITMNLLVLLLIWLYSLIVIRLAQLNFSYQNTFGPWAKFCFAPGCFFDIPSRCFRTLWHTSKHLLRWLILFQGCRSWYYQIWYFQNHLVLFVVKVVAFCIL